MRGLAAFASIAVLALAACTTGSEATSAPTQAPPTAHQTQGLAPTATPSSARLSVRVTFDGHKCIYEGPTVVLEGTLLDVEYAPAAGYAETTLLHMIGVRPGTTVDDILAYLEAHPPSDGYAPWMIDVADTELAMARPGSAPYPVSTYAGQVGGHLVTCLTSPETTDKAFAAVLLEVAGP